MVQIGGARDTNLVLKMEHFQTYTFKHELKSHEVNYESNICFESVSRIWK